jgi:hypothetical protein
MATLLSRPSPLLSPVAHTSYHTISPRPRSAHSRTPVRVGESYH